MKISENIEENLKYMKERFHTKLNNDCIIREFTINAEADRKLKHYKAFLIYFEGTTKGSTIDEFVLQAIHLMPRNFPTLNLEDLIENQLISANQLEKQTDFDDIAKGINYGGCAIFVDTLNVAFVADVKGWSDRSVSEPTAETVIKGPKDSFIELLRTNTALVRKLIKNENLICENHTVGKISNTTTSIIYMYDVVNENLLNEVRRRVKSIKTDFLIGSGELEQFIEDFSYFPMPQIISTERPDRVATAVSLGKVAIIVDGSPFALIMPTNAFELTQSQEDNYLRYPYANLVRIVRLLAIITSFLLPGIFIAIANFHQEAIPVNLLFAIEASREKVPFTMLTELIILEFAFELIREASTRIPSPGGSTIGIIGGLIIGQAAVDANIVSPIVIIIVALTGIGSFVIPNYDLGFAYRIVKYWYIFLGAIGGFFGIAFGIFIRIVLLTESQSFGVPYLAPFSPNYSGNKFGTFFVSPIFKREKRPKFLFPRKTRMQDKVSRNWAKGENSTSSPDDNTTEVE